MTTAQAMMPVQGNAHNPPVGRQWYISADNDDDSEQSNSDSESEDDNGFRRFKASHAKDGQFIMEALLDKRVTRKKGKRVIQYLVRWAGDWPKRLKTSWSDEDDIDPDEVYAYGLAHPEKAHIGKALAKKTKAKAKTGGVHAFLDVEAAEGGYESDEESPEDQDDDDFLNDEGEDVDDSDDESSDNDDGSEYTPSDDEMEVEREGSNDNAVDNDASDSDQEDMDVSEQPPAETSKNGASNDEASDSDSDSEEDAEGEEISEEEQALYASRSVFGK